VICTYDCPLSFIDLTLGRGKPYQGHEGNVRLHKIVNLHKARYLKSRRDDKFAIAEEIVQYIKQGNDDKGKKETGRFLKRVDGEEYWVEVSDTVSREKVSHALRSKPRKGEGSSSKAQVVTGVIPSQLGSHHALLEQGPAKRQRLPGLFFGSSPMDQAALQAASIEASAAVRAAAMRAALGAASGYPGTMMPAFGMNQMNLPWPSMGLADNALAMRQLAVHQHPMYTGFADPFMAASLAAAGRVPPHLIGASPDPQLIASLMQMQRSRQFGNAFR
jgi:hypothetical protein